MTIKSIVIGFVIIGIIMVGFIYPFNGGEKIQMITLNDFLLEDQTDQHTYTEDYKCMDFSIDMSNNATDVGFTSGCVTILPSDGSDGHMIVWIDTNEGRQYIEPQTDNVYNSVSDFLIEDYHVNPDDYIVIDVSINLATIING